MIRELKCAQCSSLQCRDGRDCFSQAKSHKALYDDPQIVKLHKAATLGEGKHYGKETRLGETILFAKELGYTKLGLAFCIGLREEARVIEQIMAQHFDVQSVCCKVCGVDKRDFSLRQIQPDARETMCNLAGQAQLLNEAGTKLNVLCGLCVGHDSIFTKLSNAPVTTLIAKDRVLAHNPVAAVYCPYIRKRF